MLLVSLSLKEMKMMNEAVKTILNKYLDGQGVNLTNFDEVATQLERHLDNVLPTIVHEFGDIAVHEDDEE